MLHNHHGQLYYRAGKNWRKTLFSLPAATNPKQLYATITESSPPTNGIGKAVFDIFKIEDGSFNLAEVDASDDPPKSFPSAASRYVLKQVQPQELQAFEAVTSAQPAVLSIKC